jgi:AraC family L-rhamnose operon transcriptional activator RhaR
MTFAHPVLRWDDVFDRSDRITVERHRLSGDMGAHDHDFLELVVVLGGRSTHESVHGKSSLRAGEAMLLRPGTWHVYRECEDLEVVNFCFPPSFGRSDGRELLDERVRRLLRVGNGLLAARLPEDVVRALDAMERLERRTTGSLGLLFWCLDRFADATQMPSHALHPAVERALAAIEECPSHAWTATELAKEAALDKAYLSRLFTRQIGMAPMAYLGVLRAERAAHFLRHSDMTCAEVGEAAGYASPEQFSKRFRAKHGLSPSAYRRLLGVPKIPTP